MLVLALNSSTSLLLSFLDDLPIVLLAELAPQQGANPSFQDRHVARFADEVICSCFQGLRQIALAFLPSDHKQGDGVVRRTTKFSHLTANFDTAHVGHDQVNQGAIEWLGEDPLQAFFPGHRPFDHIAFLLQLRRQVLLVGSTVINRE